MLRSAHSWLYGDRETGPAAAARETDALLFDSDRIARGLMWENRRQNPMIADTIRPHAYHVVTR